MTEEHQTPPGLVRSLLDPSPSLPFDLVRRNEDGSETKFPFRCRLLRSDHYDQALVASRLHTAKRLELKQTDTAAIESSSVFKEAQAVQIAWRACVQTDRRRRSDGTQIDLPLFANPQQMRESLDNEEFAQLLNAYEVTKSFYSLQDLSEEAVEKLIDVLANEMTGAYFLGQLASEEWPHLIYTLARLALSWRPESPPTQSDSPNTSESIPSISESGTTGSSPLPAAHVTGSQLSGMSLPTSGQISREKARELVKTQLTRPNEE